MESDPVTFAGYGDPLLRLSAVEAAAKAKRTVQEMQHKLSKKMNPMMKKRIVKKFE